jgi:integrase
MARPKKLPKGIYLRGTIYWIRYTVGGKTVQESTQTSDLKRAQGVLDARKAQIFEGRYTPNKRDTSLTVAGLRDLWLERPKTQGKASLKDDQQRFGTLVDLLGPNTLVNSLRLEDIEQLQKRLKQRKVGKKAQKPISPTTVNRHLVLLRSALKYAKAKGKQHQDPMAGIVFDTERRRDRICTPDEFQAIISSDNATVELKAAACIGYYTGMRLGEVVNMTWDRVDLVNRLLFLTADKTKTKIDNAVPIHDKVLPILEALKSSQTGRTVQDIRELQNLTQVDHRF